MAPRRTFSPGLLRLFAALLSVAGRIASLPLEYQPEVLRASAGVTYLGDNAKARRELGFAPRTLREGLPEIFTTVTSRQTRA